MPSTKTGLTHPPPPCMAWHTPAHAGAEVDHHVGEHLPRPQERLEGAPGELRGVREVLGGGDRGGGAAVRICQRRGSVSWGWVNQKYLFKTIQKKHPPSLVKNYLIQHSAGVAFEVRVSKKVITVFEIMWIGIRI